MTQKVWIARHGNRLDFVNPEWFNSAERRYDPPLSEDGLIQAQELGKRLQSENIAHIFCSPFLRTIQTANQVAEALDLPIKLEAGLSEWHNRDWMGEPPVIHPQALLEEEYPRIDWSYTSQIIPQYPEDEEAVLQRTTAIAKQLVRQFSEDILLIAHGASVVGTARGLLEANIKINPSLCGLVKLVYSGKSWRIELNGDTSHLSQPGNKIRLH